MPSPSSWDRFRRLCCPVPSVEFLVDVSRIAWPEGFLEEMQGRSEPWFSAMAALEAGAIANPDEKRMVGHYWLRAPDLAPEPGIGQAITGTARRIRTFAGQVHGGAVAPERAPAFRSLLVIGIGGSALGPQFVSDALGSASDRMRLFFLDNTDPDGMDRVFAAIDLAEGGFAATMTLVISKSGGTKETRNGMLETAAAYVRRGLDFARHAVAITGEGSELDRKAAAERWLAAFPMWDWVGGRTSVTSAVGLLPLALQGIDTDAFLGGGRLMDEATRTRRLVENPAALLAAAWYREAEREGRREMVVLPYKDRLLLFSRYLQQLVMESLGKEKDLAGNTVHQGLSVYGNKGSTDQHAFVQQLRDGVHNFFVTFLAVRRDRAEESAAVEPGITSGDYLLGFLLGTRDALHEGGRGSIAITMPDVSPRTVGALIALFERAVGFFAFMVGINAYHQPGVEAGKVAARQVLDVQRRLLDALKTRSGIPATASELAVEIGCPDRVETVFHLLEHLATGPGRGVKKRSGPTWSEATYTV